MMLLILQLPGRRYLSWLLGFNSAIIIGDEKKSDGCKKLRVKFVAADCKNAIAIRAKV